MYKEILSYTYLEAREIYPQFTSISTEQKIVTMKNNDKIDSYSNQSDIIVYYDMVEDSTPLLFIERLSLKKNSICQYFYLRIKLYFRIRKLYKDIKGYYFSVIKSNSGEFMDIVIVKKSIRDYI